MRPNSHQKNIQRFRWSCDKGAKASTYIESDVIENTKLASSTGDEPSAFSVVSSSTPSCKVSLVLKALRSTCNSN